MLKRILIVSLLSITSVSSLGCSADSVASDELAATDDELTTNVVTQDDEMLLLAEPEAFRVVLYADSTTRWVLDSDDGLGAATEKVVGDKYTFGWKKSALRADSAYAPRFFEVEIASGAGVDAFTPAILLGRTRPSGDRVLDQSIADRVTNVVAGQRVVLSLPSNRSTGYKWSVTEQASELAQATETYEADDSGRAGASGVAKFTWETSSIEAGTYDVELALARGGSTPAETLSFQIKVAAP